MKGYTIRACLVIITALASTVTIPATKAGGMETTGPRQWLEAQPSNSLVGQNSQDRTRAYLIREVRHELVMLPYYSVFDWLQFEVQGDGEVILQGQVTRPTLKSDAENVTKEIEGVTKVTNRIEVLPLSPNDDRIRRAVYVTLFNSNSPIFRYGLGAVPPIHIIVRNGHVTLKGVVDSVADRNLANIRTKGVSGVFSVTNELTVAGGKR